MRPDHILRAACAALLLAGMASTPRPVLADAPELWTTLGPPAPRIQSAMFHDAIRDRFLLYGGWGDGVLPYGDLWSLSPFVTTPTWAKLRTDGGPPVARFGPVMIHDTIADRLVLCGGYRPSYAGVPGAALDDWWTLSLSTTPPTWTQGTASGSPPAAHQNSTAVFDPVRHRMLLFPSTTMPDTSVWELALGTLQWIRHTPAGAVPRSWPPRVVYDPVRDAVIAYDGPSGAVWELTLAPAMAWNPLAVQGTPPSSRTSTTPVLDAAQHRMLVFGGFAPNTQQLNDTWGLSLDDPPTWTPLTPSGEPPRWRSSHAATFDASRDRLVVFGGASGPYVNDAWALSLGPAPAWARLDTVHAVPKPRVGHTAAYDPASHAMWIWGGYYYDGSEFYPATFNRLDLATATWSVVAGSGPWPTGRRDHAAAYDPAGNRMIVHGGRVGTNYLQDVWSWSPSASPPWTALYTSTVSSVDRRYGHAMIIDAARDRLVSFGGSNVIPYGDVRTFPLDVPSPVWTTVAAVGPSARTFARAVHDAARDRMLVFGGLAAGVHQNDAWALDLATLTWQPLAPLGTPPPGRSEHVMVLDAARDRVVVFGGRNATGKLSDAWELHLSGTPTWVPVDVAGTTPNGYTLHAAIYDPVGDRMVSFGGDDPYTHREQTEDLLALNASAVSSVPPRAAGELALGDPYPNPTTGAVRLRLIRSVAAPVEAGAYDVTGRLVRRLRIEGGPGAEVLSWDGRSAGGARVPAGLYWFRVRSGDTRACRRVVVTR